MALVSYTTIQDYAGRGATPVNNVLNSFVTQSTNVQGVNIRDEGLDERVLAANVATDGYEYVESTTRYLVRNFGAFAALSLDSAIELTNGGAGWIVGQNLGTVRLRFATEWYCAIAGGAPATSALLQFRIAYRIDGAAYAAVPKSVRAFYGHNDIFQHAGPALDYVTDYHDNFKYAFLVPYPLDGASHTINSVRIEIHTAGVNANIGATTFTAMRFVKAVT